MSAEETFGKRMRQHRQRRGWTQNTLADWMRADGVDLHPTAITRIENGTRTVRLNEAVAAATALNVELSELLHAVSCDACSDAPPVGFTCQNCGAT